METSTYSTFVSKVSDLKKSIPILLYSLLHEIKIKEQRKIEMNLKVVELNYCNALIRYL